MRYDYECETCGRIGSFHSRPFHPPSPECCGEEMQRIYGCEIDTSGCRDHDDIPEDKRVQHAGPVNAQKLERAYSEDIKRKRAAAKRGDLRMSHSIPTELYHGKRRETGDPNYWKDPKNLERHKSCRIVD